MTKINKKRNEIIDETEEENSTESNHLQTHASLLLWFLKSRCITAKEKGFEPMHRNL